MVFVVGVFLYAWPTFNTNTRTRKNNMNIKKKHKVHFLLATFVAVVVVAAAATATAMATATTTTSAAMTLINDARAHNERSCCLYLCCCCCSVYRFVSLNFCWLDSLFIYLWFALTHTHRQTGSTNEWFISMPHEHYHEQQQHGE